MNGFLTTVRTKCDGSALDTAGANCIMLQRTICLFNLPILHSHAQDLY